MSFPCEIQFRAHPSTMHPTLAQCDSPYVVTLQVSRIQYFGSILRTSTWRKLEVWLTCIVYRNCSCWRSCSFGRLDAMKAESTCSYLTSADYAARAFMTHVNSQTPTVVTLGPLGTYSHQVSLCVLSLCLSGSIEIRSSHLCCFDLPTIFGYVPTNRLQSGILAMMLLTSFRKLSLVCLQSLPKPRQ